MYSPSTTLQRCFLFSIFTPTLVICYLFDDNYSDRCEVVSHCGFDLHFPEMSVLSIVSCACWPSVCIHLWGKKNVYLDPLPLFKSGCLFSFMLSYTNYLYSLYLSDISCANIFYSVGGLFILLIVYLPVQKFFSPSCLFLLLCPLPKVFTSHPIKL